MSKLMNALKNTGNKKTKKLWGNEFRVVKNGLDTEQVVAFVDSLLQKSDSPAPLPDVNDVRVDEPDRSFAHVEATESNREEHQLKAKADGSLLDETTRKNLENILMRARREADSESNDGPRIAQLKLIDLLLNGKQYADYSTTGLSADSGESDNLVNMAALAESPDSFNPDRHDDNVHVEKESQAVDAVGTQSPASKQKTSNILTKLDIGAQYSGEIELAVAVPIDPAAVTKLYNFLQTTPDMKILYSKGSWDRGTSITVALDKPLPLLGMISNIQGLRIELSPPQKERPIRGTSGSLLGARKKEIPRIDLILKSE